MPTQTPDRMAIRLAIDIRAILASVSPVSRLGNSLQAKLDHLHAALHFRAGLGQRLAVLARHLRRHFIEARFDQSRET